MKQSPLLQFESEVFADPPGIDNETNPGIFGKSLAHWLSQQLQSQGSMPGDVIAEDFGWCVPVETRQCKVYVACSGSNEDNLWQVFVFADEGFLSRIFGKGRSVKAVETVFAVVKNLLQQSPQVQGLREAM